MSVEANIRQGGGATAFVTAMLGWYLFFALCFAAVDFPIQLPVGDLSTTIKGYSEKNRIV